MIPKIENDKTTHFFTYLVQPNLNFYLKQATMVQQRERTITKINDNEIEKNKRKINDNNQVVESKRENDSRKSKTRQ